MKTTWYSYRCDDCDTEWESDAYNPEPCFICGKPGKRFGKLFLKGQLNAQAD